MVNVEGLLPAQNSVARAGETIDSHSGHDSRLKRVLFTCTPILLVVDQPGVFANSLIRPPASVTREVSRHESRRRRRGADNWCAGEVASQEMEGWLCPALFHYFETTPMKIFARIDPLPAGVDPIWEVEEGTVVRGSDVEEHGLPT